MNDCKKLLYDGVMNPYKLPYISHVITYSDFCTDRPNPNRISRIAREIDMFLKYKRKHVSV